MLYELLNYLESRSYGSTNSFIAWIVTAAFPFYAFNSRYMQQKATEIKVSHLVEHINVIRKLKKLSNKIKYSTPTDVNKYNILQTFGIRPRWNKSYKLVYSQDFMSARWMTKFIINILYITQD